MADKHNNNGGLMMVNTIMSHCSTRVSGALKSGSTHEFLALMACALLLTFLAPQPVNADNVQTSQETLLDRIQIEDLISNYYWDMTSSGRDMLNEYYVEDAVLDVNGIVYKGHKGIQSAYTGTEITTTGKFRMLMNNPRIRVHGNTATSENVWTGIIDDTVRVRPRLYEQGREYDELVKVNGRWLFKKRVITSDAGLTAKYDKTYKDR